MTDEQKQRPNALSLRYLDSIQQSQKVYASMMDPLCRQFDLTRNELNVILFLANNPGLDRATDIVTIRKIAKSHVSLSVGNLEKRGIVRRTFEEGDRRAAHLHLTEAVFPIVRAGQHLQKEFFTRMLAGLSGKELELWGNIMEKISQNIENMED